MLQTEVLRHLARRADDAIEGRAEQWPVVAAEVPIGLLQRDLAATSDQQISQIRRGIGAERRAESLVGALMGEEARADRDVVRRRRLEREAPIEAQRHQHRHSAAPVGEVIAAKRPR